MREFSGASTLRNKNADVTDGNNYLSHLVLNDVTMTQPYTGLNAFVGTPKSRTPTDDDYDSDRDYVWTDDEEFVSDDKKIPIRRVASYDEEDRRPRDFSEVRRSVASEPPRRHLAVDDIRKLSYQQVGDWRVN